MPINTTYEGYNELVTKITRVRDFANGSDAVKDKGETYLPKLGGQDKGDYDAYKMRGYLLPAVSPTAKAVQGSIMRKAPVFDPTSAPYLLENFDGNNTSSTEFTGKMIRELLLAGGVGYLVEYDDKLSAPFAKMYTRENITNPTDDYIILSQTYTVQDEKDKFINHTLVEYLELTLDDSGSYIQNVWREEDKKYKIANTIMPTNRGEPLKAIPFVYAGENIKTDNPILLHLTNINWTHYLRSADEGHGLHWVTLPTLFLFGELLDADGNKKQIKIGAGSANHIEDTEARAELLEFTGAGMGAIRVNLDALKTEMATVGAKLLANDSGGVKAAETARIDSSSETATLSVIANTVDQAMKQLLEIITGWSNAATIDFEVNRDFIDISLDSQTLLAYLQVMQSGGMSEANFLYLLERGELLEPGVTAEDEANRITTTGADFEKD